MRIKFADTSAEQTAAVCQQKHAAEEHPPVVIRSDMIAINCCTELHTWLLSYMLCVAENRGTNQRPRHILVGGANRSLSQFLHLM
jgi:hypothetical protein